MILWGFQDHFCDSRYFISSKLFCLKAGVRDFGNYNIHSFKNGIHTILIDWSPTYEAHCISQDGGILKICILLCPCCIHETVGTHFQVWFDLVEQEVRIMAGPKQHPRNVSDAPDSTNLVSRGTFQNVTSRRWIKFRTAGLKCCA